MTEDEESSLVSFHFEGEEGLISILVNNSANMKQNISSIKKDVDSISTSLDTVTDSLITLKSGLHSMMKNLTKTEDDLESFSNKLLHLKNVFNQRKKNTEKKDDKLNDEIDSYNNKDDIYSSENDETLEDYISFLLQQNQYLCTNMNLLLAEKSQNKINMFNIQKRLIDIENKVFVGKNLKNETDENQQKNDEMNEAFIAKVKNSEKLMNLKKKYFQSTQEMNGIDSNLNEDQLSEI